MARPGAVLVALSLAGWAASAAAAAPEASFSCAHAGRPDEQIICSDNLLRAADATLGQSFAALLADASDTVRREALRADEHSWILRRNRECGVASTTRVPARERAFYVDCFLAAYDERQDDLERIRQSPGRDPGEISSPIRRSRFADAGPPLPATEPAVATTGIVSADAEHPVLAWRADGTLLMLGRDTERFLAGLYAWSPGKGTTLVSDAVADADRIDRLCFDGGDTVLVPRLAGELPPPLQLVGGGTVRLVRSYGAPPALAAACGLSSRRRLEIGDGGRLALDLGALDRPGSEDEDRFVRLRRDGETQETLPPIRIDRRVALRAQYLAHDQSFVISAAQRPRRGEAAIERVWAKTGCLAFWLVAADRTATRRCIPYGSYVGHVPLPLPTKNGLFFAVGDSGLYRIDGDEAVRVLAGPVEAAAVSPDGCRIAYARSPAAASRLRGGRPIAVYDSCPES